MVLATIAIVLVAAVQALFETQETTCIGPIKDKLDGEACGTFTLELCNPSINVLVDYKNRTLMNATISNSIRKCKETDYPGCLECVGFTEFKLEPAYAKVCGSLIMECNGFDIGSYELKCIELGRECKASSCKSCVDIDGCGWCDVSQKCLPENGGNDELFKPDDQPYCKDCKATNYHLDASTCPTPQSAHAGVFNKNTWFATFIVVVCSAATLCVVGFMSFKYYTRPQSQLGYSALSSDMTQQLMTRPFSNPEQL